MTMVDLFLNTFVDDIPQPFSTEREEVSQETLLPNQYQAQPVEQNIKTSSVLTVTAADSDPSQSGTVTADTVLTGISIQAIGIPGTAVCARTGRIYLNGVLVREIRCANTTTTETFSYGEFMPIPNWFVPKDSVLLLDFGSAQANAESQLYVSLIGYQK